MVNSEEFGVRLEKIMDFHEMTASAFADRIDVGRSSISHILSGRNKPSLDFVMRIIENFPEVELYWLLNGKGSFPKKSKAVIKEASHQKNPDLFNTEEDDTNNESSFLGEKSEIKRIHHIADKQIDRIVVFYSDGTFENYKELNRF
ncbi:helix-turn-helix domain-containing protein [Flavimarina sp. Hel_I_48]|uniref:helix-turn-helix domain-containing protein n=1 Tax=Flavimarina sp. Hel_I_48 TaxID=1392488 RepID=UPI0004DF3A6C|nr:helix-turn-helix transcriptional regulator [Flavimarina sp. Hel_I_48]